MRICLLTLDFPPFRSSGLTIYAEKIARGMAENGHHVTVLAAQRPNYLSLEKVSFPKNINVVRVPIGHLDWIGLGWQAAKYLQYQADKFDAIHFVDVHFSYACSCTFVASAFQSFRQRLTSQSGHPYHTNMGDYLFRLVYYNMARHLMEQPAINKARYILMSSQSTQREFVEHYGVDPEKTALVYPGIDLDQFCVLPYKNVARQQLNLPLQMPIILYVGFSTPRKGVEYLAQALRKMNVPSLLLMVGKWMKGYQEKFLKGLRDYNKNVIIVGYIPDDLLSIYYAAADVFVLPSLLEGFGFPLVEAMAAGLPVVTTTGSAASEIVDDAGIAVPPGDSEALAFALDGLLSDRILTTSLGEKGKKRACTLFSAQRMIYEIENVYNYL